MTAMVVYRRSERGPLKGSWFAPPFLAALLVFATVAAVVTAIPAEPGHEVLPCAEAEPVDAQPGNCSFVTWYLLRFHMDPDQRIGVKADVRADDAAHWGFYWSRWSSLGEFRISSEAGTPRTAHTGIAAAGTTLVVGPNAPEGGLGVSTGLRYRESEFLTQEGTSADHVWLIGAGSDRPFTLELSFSATPTDLEVSVGETGRFRTLAGFDEGVITHAGGVRGSGLTMGSVALATGAAQPFQLTGQVHGTLVLSGERFRFGVEDATTSRLSDTVLGGIADVHLFDITPGPWRFTVDELVGAAATATGTTPGYGVLLLLEVKPTVTYPPPLNNLVAVQVHECSALAGLLCPPM